MYSNREFDPEATYRRQTPSQRGESVVAILLVALGAFLVVSGYSKGVSFEDFAAPGWPPILFGLALAVPSLVLLIRSVWSGWGRREPPIRDDLRSKFAWAKQPTVAALALILYALVMSSLGYAVATFALALTLLSLLGWRGWRGGLAAAGLTLALYELFAVVLRIPLPSGILG